MKLLFTVAEAAEVLGVSPSSVKLLLREKKLTARKLGRLTKIPLSELQRYSDSLPVAVFAGPSASVTGQREEDTTDSITDNRK